MVAWLHLSRSKQTRQAQWDEETVRAWIAIDTDYRQKRRFLEQHAELVDVRSVDFLQRAVAAYDDDPDMQDMLRIHLDIIEDIQAREGELIERIRDTYVNEYRGFVLELPPWLEPIEARMRILTNEQANPRWRIESAAERVALMRSAIEQAEQAPDTVAPATRAELYQQLWDGLDDIEGEQRTVRQEEQISALQKALEIYTVERYPLPHATVQGCLAESYLKRIAGVRKDNIERSILACQAALQSLQLEKAPLLWVKLQRGLANTYFERIEGNPQENYEQGIACCEAALQLCTEEDAPEQWAHLMLLLGNFHQKLVLGGRRANSEKAIDYYHASLRVFTLEKYPPQYAMAQNNLGIVFQHRVAGDPIANAEYAMKAQYEALKVYTKEDFPYDYALTMYRLANISLNRPIVPLRINIESAIRASQEALTILTIEDYPDHYAHIHNGLGIAYADRPWGQSEAIELAIASYNEALKIFTKQDRAFDYSMVMGNLGAAYSKRLQGSRAANLEKSVTCYKEALSICTPELYPVEHRGWQLSLVWPEAVQHHWSAVHEAYAAAFAIENQLLGQEAGEEARAAFLKEGRDTALRDGYALTRLKRLADAAVTIERGRARGLVESLLLDNADTTGITDVSKRVRFEVARDQLRATQAVLYRPLQPVLDQETFLHEWDTQSGDTQLREEDAKRVDDYRQAKSIFDAVVAEIRATESPEFLKPKVHAEMILRAAAAGGDGHALVYLVATPWGGIALGAFPESATSSSHTEGSNQPTVSSTLGHFAVLDLPELTMDFLGEIGQTPLLNGGELLFIGGFTHAQRGSGLGAVMLPFWQGTTFRERARSIYEACVAAGKPSTLSTAIQLTLRVPALSDHFDKPLTLKTLDSEIRGPLGETLNYLYLQEEIRSSLDKLSKRVMRPLSAWLLRKNVANVTLIPCGMLEAYPLTAAQVAEQQTFADLLPASIAPNAHALLQVSLRETSQALPQAASAVETRKGVCTIGDPRPTHQELRWGEAEALTVARLARTCGMPGEAYVQYRATRERLIKALNTVQVIDASCHGMFHIMDFLRSSLHLAYGENITLADILSHRVTSTGLRLLILSACQTAIPDTRGQTDEVRSIAAAMVQAGTRAVLGSLWPVDDRATYILIVRFAQEWFPHWEHEAPALALARAQRWVRTATNRKLRAWQATTLPDFSISELQGAGIETRWIAPWHVENHEHVDDAKTVENGSVKTRIPIRGRGSRYTVSEAEAHQRDLANAAASNVCPFADPIYWAGFQIIGW